MELRALPGEHPELGCPRCEDTTALCARQTQSGPVDEGRAAKIRSAGGGVIGRREQDGLKGPN